MAESFTISDEEIKALHKIIFQEPKTLDRTLGVAQTDDFKVSESSSTMSDEVEGALDDLYHSTSASEMQFKIAVRNMTLTEDMILYLIRTFTYHAAYWPHTIERFYSFLDLIDLDSSFRRKVCTNRVIDEVAVQILRLMSSTSFANDPRHFSKSAPGRAMQLAYLQIVYSKILTCKFLSKKERDEHARIQKEVLQRSRDR